MNHISKKLLCCAVFFCLSSSTSTLYASSNTAHQTLKITIPKASLIALEKPQHTFTFHSAINEIRHNSNIAISSNDRNARLNIAVQGLPEAFALEMSVNSAVCSDISTQTSKQLSCHVGIARTKNGLLTLVGSRKNQHALPNGAYTASITYTLSD